ncbi:MAG: hypothetical protein ACOY5C_05420 [Pseudomonadota bacterium]|uniref:hypothetical protein n=1 Tax=Thermithiobacillus tepidarius TaxID=929 RepID=UPI000424E331|nr:hypothetical protein [Thermithiobacillus tepidarius]
MKKLIQFTVLSMVLALPLNGWAGPNPNQVLLQQRIQEAQQRLERAERARGAERQRLMQEHMRMMQENMQMLQRMTPPGRGTSMQEHEEWMAAHQELMNRMLLQMQREHQLLMDMLPRQ